MLTIQNKAGVTLAYLNNLESGTIKEAINGEFTLQFVATIEPLKTEFLYDNTNLIEYNNDLFRVIDLEELHTEENALTVSITAEHISYDLLKNIMLEFNYTYQTAAFVMAKCLENTGFRFLGTDITLKTDIQYTQECNSKQISIAIANNWRGELKYFRKDIELLERRGSNRGVDFRFGKNLKSIKRKRNFATDTTAYEVDIVQNEALEELGYYELGDTIRVVDEALNIEIDVRIVEIEKDLFTGLNGRVVLGSAIDKINASLSGLGNKVEEVKEEVKEVGNSLDQGKVEWDKIKDITDDLGNVIAGKVHGQLNTANTEISSTSGHITWTGNTIKIHDQPQESNSNWCMELGAAGWRIANGKDSQGAWRWRTMATGTGIVADEITSGVLSAISIQGVTITGTDITGGTVNGSYINGGHLNIGNNNYIVDRNGNLTCNGSVVLAGNVLMSGNISWSAENSPVKVQYSVDGKGNWHTVMSSGDKFARYSYDGGKTWTVSVKIVGTDGVNGADGPQGVPGTPGQNGTNGTNGQDGTDGKTLYTWVRYADNAQGGGMSQYPDGKKYIGFAYNKESPTESNTASHYKWSLIEGAQGIPGTNGTDGKTYYTWLKYADTPTTGMSDSPTNKKYMGLAYNKTTATESTNYADYSWSLIKGDKGDKGDPGLPGQNGSDGRIYYTWIKYADTPTSGMSDSPTNKKYIGMAYNKLTNVESNNYADYAWSKFVGEDGIDGQDGIPGINGTDGKTYYTWIKYSQYSDGLNMTDNSTGALYIGIAHNKLTEIESTNPKDYNWTRIKGADGQTKYTWIVYANDIYGNGITEFPLSTSKYIGIRYNMSDPKPSLDPAMYIFSKYTGDNGINGSNGVDGATKYVWVLYADNVAGMNPSASPTGKTYMGMRYNMDTPRQDLNTFGYTFFKFKGENGSDANVPSYIHETYIDSTTIKSPTIQGNVVNAGVVTGGYIRGTTIEGTWISGSSISGGSLQGANVYLGNKATDTTAYDFVTGRRLTMYSSDVGGEYVSYWGTYGINGQTLYGLMAGTRYTNGDTFYGNTGVKSATTTFTIDTKGHGIETKETMYGGALYSNNVSDLEVRTYELEHKIDVLTGTQTRSTINAESFIMDWKKRYQKGAATLEMIDRMVTIGKITEEEKQLIIL